MDNTLLVGKSLDFPHIMRIAEGMSYKHGEVIIKARGKQIQRAVEAAVMLQQRGRGVIGVTEYGVCDSEVHIPTISIIITV